MRKVNSLNRVPANFSWATALQNPLLGVIIGLVLAMMVGYVTTFYKGIATFAYCLMVCGVIFRKQRPIHIRLMLGAIAIDLLLVLTLQIQRNAVQTAISFTLTPLEQAHIAMSSVATALYFPVLFLGIMRLKNRFGTSGRRWHMQLGTAAFVFRTLGFILMFSLIERMH